MTDTKESGSGRAIGALPRAEQVAYERGRRDGLEAARAGGSDQQPETEALPELEVNDYFSPSAPEVEWLIKDWMPQDGVTVLSGRGGSGKTRIALQLACAIACDEKFFLAGSEKGPATTLKEATPVMFATWETSKRAFNYRVLQATENNPDKLVGCLAHVNMRKIGEGMWGVKKEKHMATRGDLLPAGDALLQAAEGRKAKLLVVDPVAAAFMQNENDRALVRAYLAWLGKWSEETGCAVLLISHPAKTASEAQSGSTDWRNGVQAVWELGPERAKNSNKQIVPLQSEKRVLRVDKLNEGKAPAGVTVGWDRGRFICCKPSAEALEWTGTIWDTQTAKPDGISGDRATGQRDF